MMYKLICEKYTTKYKYHNTKTEVIGFFNKDNLESDLKKLIKDYRIEEINECFVDEVYNDLLNGEEVDAGVDFTGYELNDEWWLSWHLIKEEANK